MATSAPLSADDLRRKLSAAGVPEAAPIAVAVSGGADSMCLALLASALESVTALIVDHGLRDTSSDEAALVCRRLDSLGLAHELLVWEHDILPASNIQAEARNARYEIMKNWCVANDVRYLLTAHHRDDQAETVLLRLARGSGVYGLSGMSATRDLGADVTLVRPFLDEPKQRLVDTVLEHGIDWVEDPSNQNDAFDRVRIRTFLGNPPLEGLNSKRLAETAARLRRTRDAIAHYEAEWLQDAVEFHEAGYALLKNKSLADAPVEIVLRGLSNLSRFAGGQSYAPRFEKLERLFHAIRDPNFKGQTLHGVQFLPLTDELILAVREHAAAEGPAPLKKRGVWDNRFEFSSNVQAGEDRFIVRALGDEGRIELSRLGCRMDSVPAAALATLPAIFDGESLIAVPHLGYGSNSEINLVLTHQWLSLSKTGKKTYRDVQ